MRVCAVHYQWLRSSAGSITTWDAVHRLKWCPDHRAYHCFTVTT